MDEDFEIESTTRQVIQNKLLTALDDDDVVAVLYTKEDLLALLAMCEGKRPGKWFARQRGLIAGFQELLKAAFPN